MKRVLLALLLLLGLAAGYLLLAPVSIEPVAWTPPANPIGQGLFRDNGLLARHSRIELGGAVGPEDIVVSPDGTLVTGVADGRILSIRRGEVETLVNTGGRPLGLDRDSAGRLWVADGERGLLRLGRSHQVEFELAEVDGQPLGIVDDVSVGPDGRVWFTDADATRHFPELEDSLLEGGPTGRLLVLDPATGEARVFLDGLHFPNGVAVGDAGRYLLLSETLRQRIHKVWIDGPQAGEHELILEGLPGFPDNITSAGGGAFWVALAGPRTPLKDLAQQRPLLRKVAARLPDGWFTRPRSGAIAVAINHRGTVLHVMNDPEGRYRYLTTVLESGRELYLGSLEEGAIGRATAPLRVR